MSNILTSAKRIARGAVPAPHRRVRALENEIIELRADINELRRDNLRIAELHDIVVTRLSELAKENEQ